MSERKVTRTEHESENPFGLEPGEEMLAMFMVGRDGKIQLRAPKDALEWFRHADPRMRDSVVEALDQLFKEFRSSLTGGVQ